MLVAGVVSLAVVGPTASGPDAERAGPGVGQDADGEPTAKTRVGASGGETEVARALAAGASARVPVPSYRMYDSRNDPAGDLNIALGGNANAKAHVIIDITGYYEATTT
ncbi:MAG: hypothetical protein ACR2O6_01535 [Ilumatobacteraceae bacterium]